MEGSVWVKRALLVTRVSGFIPQHEMNNVKILQEMGYEVHYATNLNVVVYGRDNSRLEGTGIITHQIDFERSPFSLSTKKALGQLEHLMMKIPFDLIHCHMPMSGALARQAAQNVRRKTGRKVPVLYTAHGFHFCAGAPWKDWIYYPIERYMARYTDCLITMNQEDYRRACRFPVRGSVKKINGVGIRLERFEKYQKENWEAPQRAEVPEGEEDIRKKYGIPADYRIAVSVGELSERKNHIMMIEAMAQAADVNLVYLICGDGEKKEAICRRALELGLEKQVILTGYVDNVPALLQQCDVFLFPSTREGLPVAVMEAMAVGLPVIASDIRGNRDLIKQGRGGCLVKGFESFDYARRLRWMFLEKADGSVTKQERRREMGLWNRKRIQKFTLATVEKQMRAIYNECKL